MSEKESDSLLKRGTKRSIGESPMSSSTSASFSMSTGTNDFPSTPRSIVTWNADGLAARAKNARNAIVEFQQLLEKTKADLVCIQEARLKCVSSTQRGKPMESELKEVEPLLKHCQSTYETIWSLADKRQAGTLMLVHRNLLSCQKEQQQQNTTTNMTKKRALIDKNVAFSVSGTIKLLLEAYKLQDDQELKEMIQKHNNNHKSTSTTNTSNNQISSPPKKKQQTSMASFFKPKVKKPTASSHGATSPPVSFRKEREHHSEGRIQFIRFADLDVLHTYVPNNGKDVDKFERRRVFDLDMQHLLVTRKKILEKANDGKDTTQNNTSSERPILWLGDLNVARTYRDGTDYIRDKATGRIKEFWTDPIRCPDAAVRGSSAVVDPGTIGLPGFTANERRRFEEMLQRAKLTDVWRSLHPDGIGSESVPHLVNGRGGVLEENPWNRAEYTWRGRYARRDSNVAKARYQGKGQRIDYFLLSENALDRVESCHILGYGEFMEGFFCGSDHCASVLVLNKHQSTVCKSRKGD